MTSVINSLVLTSKYDVVLPVVYPVIATTDPCNASVGLMELTTKLSGGGAGVVTKKSDGFESIDLVVNLMR